MAAQTRVALLDFTADDNAWPGSVAARDFTAVLQAELSGLAGIEWVERAELKAAERELQISELGLLTGSQAIQRGKWVKADWLLVGRFAFDDEEQRVVKLELLDLNHAETLAEKVVILGADKSIKPAPAQLTPVMQAARAALIEGASWLQRATNQFVIAPLFFCEVSSRSGGSRENLRPLEKRFQEFMTEWSGKNPDARLLRFSRAYQSLDEAVLAAGGFTDAVTWPQLANFYVWGTCEITNARAANGRLLEKTVRLSVTAWDGAGAPLQLEERRSFPAMDEVSLPTLIGTLEDLLERALKNVARGNPRRDSLQARRQIAAALLQDFDKLNSVPGRTLGLTHSDDECERFQGVVRMLEAACFFDPGNAGAQARRISTRWGWWMDFGGVSNEFWSKWRRNEEWGAYGERFGLAPVIKLPFPFHTSGIAGAYEEASRDLLQMMRVYNKEQAYGFPSGVPAELQQRWLAEMETEAKKRSQRAAAELPRQPAANPRTNQVVRPNPGPDLKTFVTSPMPQIVSAAAAPADWMNHLPPLFAVNRPLVLPPEVTPRIEVISFPPRAGVTVVNQLVVANDSLWIVAESEKSEGVNVAQPDITLEVAGEGSHLWRCDFKNPQPQLVTASGLPGFVASVAVQGDALWVAGNGIAQWQPLARPVKTFGARDGFTLADVTSVTASANGDVYAVGDRLKILRLPARTGRWVELPVKPVKGAGAMSYGSSDPLRVCAQGDDLLLVAGALVLREAAANSWTNYVQLRHSTYAVAADAGGFWIGEHDGLIHLDPQRRLLKTWAVDDYPGWRASQYLTSPAMLRLQARDGYDLAANRQLSQAEALERMLRHEMDQFAQARERVCERRRAGGRKSDALELSNRFPGGVRALAHDGEFLWLGFEQPGMVLLYHKPTDACVAWVKLGDSVRSLAASADHLWIGLGYRETKLVRMDKAELLAVPPRRWRHNRVPPDEFAQVLERLPLRQQALHHFFAGNHARALDLLTRENATDLEGMFLRAYCRDAYGLDQPEECVREFEKIGARFPNSPWEKAAQAAIATNQRVRQERAQPGLKQQRVLTEQRQIAERFQARAAGVFQRCDMDGDQKLNPMETMRLWHTLPTLFQVPPQIQMKWRSYDLNQDSNLDATEFRALIEELRESAGPTPAP